MTKRTRLSLPLIRAQRFIAWPLASMRQAEKQFPQADPLPFHRRFAPLTPAAVHASRFASANTAKEIFVSAVAVITLFVPFASYAQDAASHRLVAEDFSLVGPAGLQTAVWADKIAKLRADRAEVQALAPGAHLKPIAQVWTTTFKGADRSYVVSAVNNGCTSSSADPNSLTCPARVVEIIGGKTRVIADFDLPISSVRGEYGFDASSNSQTRFMTIASFDPATRSISFTDVSNGEKSPIDVHIKLQ